MKFIATNVPTFFKYIISVVAIVLRNLTKPCLKCEVELFLSDDILSINFILILNLILQTKFGHYIVSWISSISTVFSWNSFWLYVLFWTLAGGLGGLHLSKGPSKGLFKGGLLQWETWKSETIYWYDKTNTKLSNIYCFLKLWNWANFGWPKFQPQFF